MFLLQVYNGRDIDTNIWYGSERTWWVNVVLVILILNTFTLI